MRRTMPLTLLAALTCAGATALALLDGDAGAAFSNIALIATAAAAGAAGVFAGIRAGRGRARLGWTLLGAGCFSWAGGNVVWAYNEHVLHAEVLFPSVGDFFYLGFPLLLPVALWFLPGRTNVGSKASAVLDGLIVTFSAAAVLWITTMSAVWEAGADTRFAFLVALAYPVGDVVTVTMVFLLLTCARAESRLTFGLLAAGLLGFVVADVMFSLYTSAGTYVGGGIVDLGWIAGFCALALAAVDAARHPVTVARSDFIPGWQLGLPYVPFVAAVALSAWYWSTGTGIEAVQVILLATVLALILLRQLVTLTHNSALTQQLHHQAFHDELTGIGNRALFTDALTRAVGLHERGDRDFAVLSLDLDDFKLINDTLGHDAGDVVLQTVADRLSACVRSVDTVARLGGDEFAVLLEHGAAYQRVAERVLLALTEPIVLRGSELVISGSVGLTVHDRTCAPGRHASEEVVLKEVDLALYAAKGQGKNRVAFFSEPMRQDFDSEVSLRADLVRALDTGQIRAAYQPIVELSDGRLLGFEALARWQHPTQGEVPPVRFIPLAETTGLIPELGRQVLERACADFSAWALDPSTYLSVNVSPLELTEPGYVAEVRGILQRHGMAASSLVLEITEGVMLDSSTALEALHALRALGVRLAVDDFGDGYASLRYLQSLPLDILKIDRSYVSNAGASAEADQLLEVIVHIARTMGLSTVAEGIEEHPEMLQLNSLGCDAGQGYLLSRPMEAAAVPAYLSAPADARAG